MADYRFLDEWRLPADVERVYDLVARRSSTRAGGARSFLAAEGDGGEAAPGKRVTVKARGFLPYYLRFTIDLPRDRPAVPHPLAARRRLRGNRHLAARRRTRRHARAARLAPLCQQKPRVKLPDAGAAAALPLEPHLDDAARRGERPPRPRRRRCLSCGTSCSSSSATSAASATAIRCSTSTRATSATTSRTGPTSSSSRESTEEVAAVLAYADREPASPSFRSAPARASRAT